MYFEHEPGIWRDFPALVPGVLVADGITQDTTSSALIVAEALHSSAAVDVAALVEAIAGELDAVWSVRPAAAVLTPGSPRFSSSP